MRELGYFYHGDQAPVPIRKVRNRLTAATYNDRLPQPVNRNSATSVTCMKTNSKYHSLDPRCRVRLLTVPSRSNFQA